MHDGMPYGRNQGQGQGHSREVPPSPFAWKSGGGVHDPQLLWERRPWLGGKEGIWPVKISLQQSLKVLRRKTSRESGL